MPSRRSARLPFRFDATSLRRDVDGLTPDDWVPHFNPSYYEGDWCGVALRSIDGHAGQLYPDPTGAGCFADTPTLARCPAARRVLDQFSCPLLAVRFLRLGPHSRIKEHADLNLGYEDGEVRIHVPVMSSPDVAFLLGGDRIDMAEGEAWYLDLNLPHSVVNSGASARVHLVVDCVVDPWLDDVLTSAISQTLDAPAP